MRKFLLNSNLQRIIGGSERDTPEGLFPLFLSIHQEALWNYPIAVPKGH